jgi:hypothetical protein
MAFWTRLGICVLVYWCAIHLSSLLRAGEAAAAGLTAVWLLLWLAVDVIDAIPKAFTSEHDEFDFYSVIGIGLFTLPIYFAARGLIAFWAHRAGASDGPMERRQIPSYPWESIRGRAGKHPSFVNKWNLSLYLLLILVPLPYLFFLLSGKAADSPIVYEETDAAFFVLQQVGSIFLLLAIWLPLTVFLYRRARRRALLPAIELSRRASRPPILYLRSFHDDRITMRARAANGRSLLERVLKIRFEEVVTDHLWRYGPVVAIGRPGERLPPLGAARDYVPDEHWQRKVEELMAAASLIIVVVGRTEGLAWELRKIIELRLVHRIIVLFPPLQVKHGGARGARGDLPERWEALRAQARGTGLALSHNIDYRTTRAMVFPSSDVAHAITSSGRDDWTYETVLDAAAELAGPTARNPPVPKIRSQGTRTAISRGASNGRRTLEYLFMVSLVLTWALVVLPPVVRINGTAGSGTNIVYEDDFSSNFVSLDGRPGIRPMIALILCGRPTGRIACVQARA